MARPRAQITPKMEGHLSPQPFPDGCPEPLVKHRKVDAKSRLSIGFNSLNFPFKTGKWLPQGLSGKSQYIYVYIYNYIYNTPIYNPTDINIY